MDILWFKREKVFLCILNSGYKNIGLHMCACLFLCITICAKCAKRQLFSCVRTLLFCSVLLNPVCVNQPSRKLYQSGSTACISQATKHLTTSAWSTTTFITLKGKAKPPPPPLLWMAMVLKLWIELFYTIHFRWIIPGTRKLVRC